MYNSRDETVLSTSVRSKRQCDQRGGRGSKQRNISEMIFFWDVQPCSLAEVYKLSEALAVSIIRVALV
jgi:hypothetical protein